MNNETESQSVVPSVPTSTIVDRLAEALGGRASASMVYGEPVERDGVTVIPVAKVRYAFGGGFGNPKSSNFNAEGGGGGGGATVIPIGYVELKNGGSTFRPICDPSMVGRAVVAGGFLGLVMLKRLLRGRK